MMIPLCLLATTYVTAAEAPQRPDVGDYVPSYASTKCGGIDDGVPAGKTLCYTCRAGREPIFYILVRQPSDSLVKLVKQIEKLVVARKEENAAAVVNFLGDPANEQARQDIADFGAKYDLRNVSLTITGDGSKFDLDAEDEVTVILFENGIIRLRNSARLGAFEEKTINSIVRRSKALLE
jgi:hypothetical protein